MTRLREAGAVILGKTNLTELANFMAEQMPSGYSSLGGQVLNPYDVSLTPCGSSSGSGAAAALGLATVTVGTETDGSILCPSDAQSLVGLKPTLGLVSGEGILPIATSQDCAGPMCRTVSDAAALLGALTGEDYASALRPGALDGTRLAVPPVPEDLDPADRELYEAALGVLRDLGAVTVEVPPLPETDETPVLHHEFARDLDAYLSRLPPGAPIRTMAELAAWNEAHADVALKYGQAHLVDRAGGGPPGRGGRLPGQPGPRPGRRGGARHRRDPRRRRRGGRRDAVLARRRGGGAGRVPQPGRAGRLPPVRAAPVRGRLPGPGRVRGAAARDRLRLRAGGIGQTASL